MIVIVGATGTTGRHIVNALKAKGTAFTALVRKPEDAKRLEKDGVRVALGDMDKPKSLDAAFKGASRIYVVAPPSPDLPRLEGNVFASAKRARVELVVKHSGLGASPHAACSFSRWNGWSEIALEELGMPATILRPHSFMQNLLGMAGMAAKGAIHAYGAQVKLGWIDARDVADAAATVLTEDGHEGRVYELTGPEALSYADVAALLSAQLKRTILCNDVSERMAFQAMVGAGAPPVIADGVLGLMNQFRGGAGGVVTGTFGRLTGAQPRRMDDFLAEHRAAFVS